jgi:hypothetical protein
MNNKLEKLREEYKHRWGYESDIRQDYGFTLKEIADFFLSRFATIIDDQVIWQDIKGCIELWDLKNGLTLCRKCHYKLDNRKYYG